MNKIGHRALGVALASAAVAVTGLVPVASAGASTVNANLSAGSLAFGTGGANLPAFTGTLNGADQTITGTGSSTIDVSDATGSGSGWKVQATSTQFSTTSPVHTLSTTATTISAVTDACDTGALDCLLATNNIAFPYTLPAGVSATATSLYNATAATGMGNQTITPTWKLTVPATAYAGNYSSTWTLSLVTGP